MQLFVKKNKSKEGKRLFCEVQHSEKIPLKFFSHHLIFAWSTLASNNILQHSHQRKHVPRWGCSCCASRKAARWLSSDTFNASSQPSAAGVQRISGPTVNHKHTTVACWPGSCRALRSRADKNHDFFLMKKIGFFLFKSDFFILMIFHSQCRGWPPNK